MHERFDLIRKERELEWYEYNWTTVPGFENYEISDFGVIRNKKTKYELKPGVDRYGYLYQKLRKPGSRKTYRVAIHRAVAMMFVNDEDHTAEDDRCEVDHIDRDKTNNNWWNLEWVTPRENKARYWAIKRAEMRKLEKVV
jgi:hypothetical protein